MSGEDHMTGSYLRSAMKMRANKTRNSKRTCLLNIMMRIFKLCFADYHLMTSECLTLRVLSSCLITMFTITLLQGLGIKSWQLFFLSHLNNDTTKCAPANMAISVCRHCRLREESRLRVFENRILKENI